MQKKIEEIAKKHSIPENAVQELMNCFQDAVSSLKTVEPQPSIINSELDTQKRDENTVITSSAVASSTHKFECVRYGTPHCL